MPYDFTQSLKKELSNFDYENMPLFCTISQVSVYGLVDEIIKMKKESKPKQSELTKGWGSKNSQMRLDKATSRYAKKINNGNVARYY
jgi:hypothetical protein